MDSENAIENEQELAPVQLESSLIPTGTTEVLEPVRNGHNWMSSWTLVILLIFTFFLLKYFIYIEDEKRKGK